MENKLALPILVMLAFLNEVMLNYCSLPQPFWKEKNNFAVK